MLSWVVVSVLAASPASNVRVRAVGDVMLGTSFPEGHLPPDDGAKLLADVAEWMADADLTFANLEGPLCDGGKTTKCGAKKNCFAFRSPTRYGQYLKAAGVKLASVANNHAGDFGEECRAQTQKTLDALGIAWSGPPGSVATVAQGELKVALVAFHASAATNNVNDVPAAVALVKKARAEHDRVIVSFHAGAEGVYAARVPVGVEMFHGENRGDVRAFAHAVVDAGADLVLGHGPHVLRALEVYRGRLIAYSLGNFATYGRFELSGIQAVGMVLEAELGDDGRLVRGRILGTRQLGKGVPTKDASNEAARRVRELSMLDFPRTAPRISAEGELLPPP